MYGELIPVGGGDPIPLLKKNLLVGRRESCDIVLRFSNVSAHHCQLVCNGGYWYVKDLKSRNGVKVNGLRVRKRLDPGDELVDCQAPLRRPLLAARSGGRRSAAGRGRGRRHDEAVAAGATGRQVKGTRAAAEPSPSSNPGMPGRYDIMDDSQGRFKDSNRPV